MAVFTDRFLKGLKPRDTGFEERDAGCPGLAIRVGKKGMKVWEVVVPDGRRRRRVRLGTYPAVSLAMARRLAADAKAAPQLHAGGMRVRELWGMYSAEIGPARRAFDAVETAWRLWAEPKIGDVRVEDLGLRHGADLIATVSRKVSPARARKVVRYINPMLKWAAGRGLMAANPWAGLHVPEGSPDRDRVLGRDEWGALWNWAVAEPYPMGPWLRFLVLSGQRLREVAGLAWSEIEGDVWAIPAARHKSKRRHEVPLSAALRELLDSIARHDAFAFSARAGRPINPGSTLKARIDEATGVKGWTFHDIRRTAATLMGEGGVPRFTIERVLGHVDPSVTAIYDRHLYREEKRAALEVLARTVSNG